MCGSRLDKVEGQWDICLLAYRESHNFHMLAARKRVRIWYQTFPCILTSWDRPSCSCVQSSVGKIKEKEKRKILVKFV